MNTFVKRFYKLLMVLACLSMLTAFGAIMLGVAAREFVWDIPGLDAYAGYAIAATLFLALPETLRHGDHIRVTMVLQHLPARVRNGFEIWCLLAGVALSGYFAWFACHLVWVSYSFHDVSPAADATPLWLPQLLLALGSIGFAVSFADALISRLQGREFFEKTDNESAHAE